MKNAFANKSEIDKLQLIAFIGITGFVIAVIYHYLIDMYFYFPWQYNSFLCSEKDCQFSDFYEGVYLVGQDIRNFLNPYSKASGCPPYFPFAFIVSTLFTFFNWHIGVAILSLLTIGTFVCFLYYTTKNLETYSSFQKIQYIILLTITSYPLLFLIDRGNNEEFIFILLCLFIYLYKKGKFLLSVIPLACAISMKGYPVVFIVLLISDKKYKETILCLLLSLGMTLLSILLMKGGITFTITEFVRNFHRYKAFLVMTRFHGGGDYDHSLFIFCKRLLSHFPGIDSATLLSLYLIITLAGFTLITLYVIFTEKVFWKKVLLLVLPMILFPHVSHDYTLIHLYIPMMLFVGTNEKNHKLTLVFCVLFGLLIIPKHYVSPLVPKTHLIGLLEPLLMLSFIGIIFKEGFSQFKKVINHSFFIKIK